MGKATGFLDYKRKDGEIRPESERTKDFFEFHCSLKTDDIKEQAARCIDCGIPYCQGGELIAGMMSGCPLHNLIPEINDLVYKGRMEEAYRRLSITHSFPEFTSRVCPALCEAACTCSLHDKAVATKENERAVIEYAFANDLVKKNVGSIRTGKKVAVIGSGPSGLAAADLLNSRGHKVVVYERNDRVGGLLRYGIPNMKLDKSIIDRRVKIMEEEGIEFRTGINVGVDITAKELSDTYDCVILACGASKPRDINAPGRDAKGIFFAVDFLTDVTKYLLDHEFKKVPYSKAKDMNVVVIGGGDTGNDCVGTCIRLGAKNVTQLEMMPKPAEKRTVANPWPEWPKVLKVDYGQEEAIWKFGHDPRVYQTTVKEFIKDKDGNLSGVKVVSLEKKTGADGRIYMEEVKDSEKMLPADMVLIAAGFLGSEDYVTEAFDVDTDARSNVKTGTDSHLTSKKNVYVAGDMHIGQSLVVRAIAEGRCVAKEVDFALMGYTNL